MFCPKSPRSHWLLRGHMTCKSMTSEVNSALLQTTAVVREFLYYTATGTSRNQLIYSFPRTSGPSILCQINQKGGSNVSVHTTPGEIWRHNNHFRVEKLMCTMIVFEKLRFQMFSFYTKTLIWRFQISPVWRAFSKSSKKLEKLRFKFIQRSVNGTSMFLPKHFEFLEKQNWQFYKWRRIRFPIFSRTLLGKNG